MYGLNYTENKSKIAIGIVLSVIFCLATLSSNVNLSSADELDDKLSADQEKLKQINEQIKSYQQQIASTQSKASTLKGEISVYNNQIAATELQIEARQTQINDAHLQITRYQELIDQKAVEIAENKKILGQLIVEINEFDDQYALKTTVGSTNLSDFLDQIQYTQNLQGKVYQFTQKIKNLRIQLQKEQHDLQVKAEQLIELKTQLEITQTALLSIKDQKQKLLNQTQGLEKNYQALLATSKQDADNLQKEIDDLDAQVRARLGPRSVPAGKGVLAWPIDGIMTQKYGNTGFTALGYNFHNGLDIAAPAGEPIYAAADGEVIYTDRSDASYGNWVAIKHNITTNNGTSQLITLYAHFQSFKVSPGQQVKQGDLIGYEGNSGNTTKKLYGPERGYHLHFTVFDAEGFGVQNGKYTKIYGPYRVPYGYTYNPLEFLD